MSEVQLSPYTLGLDSRDVLQPAHPDEDDVVLLQVVTLAWDVGRQLSPVRKSHQHTLEI